MTLGEFYCKGLNAPVLVEIKRDDVVFARVYDIRGSQHFEPADDPAAAVAQPRSTQRQRHQDRVPTPLDYSPPRRVPSSSRQARASANAARMRAQERMPLW